MTVTPSSLRGNFPEFSNATNYPDSLVGFWLGVSDNLMLPAAQRWGNMYDFGIQLLTAHHLVLARRAIVTASNGGVPGVTSGAIANKAVDKVSVGYDSSNVTLDKGGMWNLTEYGIQFLQLSRQIGSGGFQSTGCLNPQSQGAFPWQG